MAVAAVSKHVSNVSVQGFQRKIFQFFEMVDVWSFTPRQKGSHVSVTLYLEGGKSSSSPSWNIVIPRKELTHFISCIILMSFHCSILPKLLTFLRDSHTCDCV